MSSPATCSPAVESRSHQLSNIFSNIHFLCREERHETEKPYILRYAPTDGFPAQNVATQPAAISLSDLRTAHIEPYDASGISIAYFETGMSYPDFSSENKILEVYIPGLCEAVRLHFAAEEVRCIPHIVELPEPHYSLYKIRRQPPSFPRSTGDHLDYEVPATVAHIDANQSELLAAIERSGIEDVNKYSQVEWVNCWAPLRGPIKQWPLAVCQSASISIASDTEATDLVYNETMHREFLSIYEGEGQEWYYLSDQVPQEHILFRQASLIDEQDHCGVPHASFPTKKLDGVLRESIEVKLLVLTSSGA